MASLCGLKRPFLFSEGLCPALGLLMCYLRCVRYCDFSVRITLPFLEGF